MPPAIPRPEQHPSSPRVAVLGAGVIGSVLAARLQGGGVDTSVVARGATADRIARQGLVLRRRDEVERASVPVVDPADPGTFDIVVLAVRASDLDGVLPVVDEMGAPLIVTFMHLGDRHHELVQRYGADRVIRAFPGLGGRRTDGGVIEWLDLGATQPTTLDGAHRAHARARAVLERTGLPVDATDDMDGWMQVHTVFIATIGAAIIAHGGDLTALAADRPLLRQACDATRDGFRALRDHGVRIQPRSLDVLYLRMPRWFAVAYWRRALPSPTGEVTMAPHAVASQHDEMPVLWEEAIRLTGGGRRGLLARFLTPFLHQVAR